MPLTDATLDLLADELATLCPYASLHSADPGTDGSNETTAAREAVVFGSTDGVLTMTGTETFTGGASGGDVTYVGLWSDVTGGTFRGSFPLTGDASFSSAGEFILNTLVISGTSADE